MQAVKFVFGIIVGISLACAADFFPLQLGNIWVYRSPKAGQRFTVAIGPPVMMSGREYHELFGYAAQPELVRLNEKKNLVRLDSDTGNEQMLTSFLTSKGGWWEAPARSCNEEAITLERGTVYDGPASPFRDVREISYRVLALMVERTAVSATCR